MSVALERWTVVRDGSMMADSKPQRTIDTAPLAASSWIGVVSQM